MWNGYRLGVWIAVNCSLVQDAMTSSSSSGAVVSVPVSVSSSSPPTSGCSDPVAGGSVYETSALLLIC